MATKKPLIFSNLDIHFNYVFDIGKTINPIDAARTILQTDLGQAFRNYTTHKSEIGDSYKSISEDYKNAQNLEDIGKELETRPNLFTYLKIFRHAPLKFVKAYFRAFQDTFTESTKNKQKEVDYKKPLREIRGAVGEAVTDLLSLLTIREYVDRDIFQTSYLENASFARVGLKPFGATIKNDSILFDATLTIHRTGIAILTIYSGFSGKQNHKDLLDFQKFSELPIKDCELPYDVAVKYTNLLDGYVLNFGSSREFAEDERGYTRLDNGEVINIGGILDAYRFYCTQAILDKKFWSIDDLLKKARSTNWFFYPVIFIHQTKPNYISASKFRSSRATEIAKLVLSMDGGSKLKSKIINDISEQDMSLVDNYSTYLTEGGGTVIYYNSQRGRKRKKDKGLVLIQEEFSNSVVVEMLLLQKGILETFNNQLSQATFNLAKLTQLKQEYIYALQEFEAIGISYYGEVHEIIKRGHRIFRINDLRKLFELKLQGVEGLIQKAEESYRARRERVFKILTTLVAVVFSVNGAQSVVDTILKWPHVAPSGYPDFLKSSYDWILMNFIEHPTIIVIGIYLLTILITVIALWYETIPVAKSKKKVIREPSFPTNPQATISPIELNITQKEQKVKSKKNR